MTTNERIVYSAVAVPGEPDYDGEVLTPEEIQHAAHAYLRDYRVVDPEHTCALGHCVEVGVPVESYITTSAQSVKSFNNETIELPVGTWVIGIEVTDDKIMESIKRGEKTGVSLTAKRADGVTKSRVLIRDLGPDWVARTVSIVKNPAVPKAKFFAIKGVDSLTEENVIREGFEKVVEAIKGKREEPTIEEPVVEEADATKSEEPVEPVEEEVVVEEEETTEAVKFVTFEDLETAKSEILEVIKSIKLVEEEEAVKAEEEPTTEDEKDKLIQELKAEIEELKKQKSATKSKAIPDHFATEGESEAIKNLYLDDGRDMYGRVIK